MADRRTLRALETESTTLRMALASVASQATAAIARMDEGQRPSPYMDAAVFNHALVRAEQAAARLDVLLSLVDSSDAEEVDRIIREPKF